MKKKYSKQEITISIIVGLITLLLVSSMSIQFKTVDRSQESDIESLRSDELKTQIASYKSKYEETMEQYEETKNTISEYVNTMEDDKESTDLLDKELKDTQTLLGLTDVQGEGVIITLKDTDEATYSASDLLTLINELKYVEESLVFGYPKDDDLLVSAKIVYNPEYFKDVLNILKEEKV